MFHMNINIEADFSDSDRKKSSISMIVFVSNKILKLTKSKFSKVIFVTHLFHDLRSIFLIYYHHYAVEVKERSSCLMSF